MESYSLQLNLNIEQEQTFSKPAQPLNGNYKNN